MDKKRNLLLTFLVAVGIVIVNRLTGEIFNGLANKYLAEFLNELKAAALAVLGAFILKKMWIYRRFDLALLKKGWTAGIPQLLVLVLPTLGMLANKPSITAGPVDILFFVLMMICVGLFEETVFRGLLQNAFHEFFGEDTVGHVILAVVCAGFCFGAVHLTNATRSTVTLRDAATQAFVASGAGMLLGAIYFRTGKNLWYNMLLHTLHDTVTFIQTGGLSGADSDAVISGSVQNGNGVLLYIGQFVFYVIMTLFVLRRKKVEPLLKKTETEVEPEV
jgi:membrane protease YdiL (CAAX protease family)